jgi:hypothetical protein
MPYYLPAPYPDTRDADTARAFGAITRKIIEAIAASQGAPSLSRKPTGGVYTPPSGTPTTISPAEQVAPGQVKAGQQLASLIQNQIVPSGVGQFEPTSYSGFSLGPSQLQQDKSLERTKTQAEIRETNASAALKEHATKAGFREITLADGRTALVAPSTTGSRITIPSIKQPDLADEMVNQFLENASTSATGPATLPTDLPKTDGLKEGTVVRDPTTRRAIAILQDGTWIPYTE